ncbi:HET-domain-containing protein [Jackrogersella minutella]|nr:HET-domain-containing protein [Jackrogersella minutella]
MLCNICRNGLEGIWDPENTKRVGLMKDFPSILENQFVEVTDGNYDEALDNYEAGQQEPGRYVFSHHDDYDSVLQSKELGCVVCDEIASYRDPDDRITSLANVSYYSLFQVDLPRDGRSQAMMVVYSGDPVAEFAYDLIAVHDEKYEMNPSISRSTSDLQTWTLIQTWIDECFKSHELCLHRDSEIFSPARLLELRQMNDEKAFRLVHRGEFDPRERYVTLSHCWGSGLVSTKLRLLKSTQDSLREGFPVSILPKTFRDAFEVIDRLKIRYLWIDRLCIVQDSVEDWQAEASIMQSVYSHGLLNIAALGAADDQAGCFFDRDPALVAPTIVDLSPRDGSIAMLYRVETEREAWRKAFEGEPLLSRAWVVQERILSTRNLYFGSKQVFWECIETNHCETVPNVRMSGLLGDYASDFKGTASSKYMWKYIITPNTTVSSDLTGWPGAVETYSQCKMTFPRDKLVAISGLAKQMGEKLRIDYGPGHDRYLAGLWEHGMPQTLLWRAREHGHRISSYLAPSWSWASLDGDVILKHMPNSPCHVDFLKAEVVPQGNDVTGALLSSVITLRGHVCRARNFKRAVNELNTSETHNIRSFHYIESDLPVELWETGSWLQFDDKNDSYETVDILLFNCLPTKTLSMVTVLGLALVYADESRSCYRRVGHVSLTATVNTDESDFEGKLYDRFPTRIIEII